LRFAAHLTLSFFVLAIASVPATPKQAARPAAATADLQQFAGKWTALHKGTPILVLELHVEKGKLAGGIQVCGFTINTEDNGKIVEITDSTLSAALPVSNLEVSGKSLSFDWKDPDGDENHWKLELTGSDAGQLRWIGLPKGLTAEPIPVTKDLPTKS
jgi:hypothetical protein